MTAPRVLVIEDEPSMQEFYTGFFTMIHPNGFVWHLVDSGEKALEYLDRNPVDIVLLDWNLPGITGLETLRRIRQKPSTREIRVFMITARTEPKHVISGLQAGADDYLRKPFDPDELLARLRCLIRRLEPAVPGRRIYEVDGLRLDTNTGFLAIDGKPVKLEPVQLALLEIFLRWPNMIHSPRSLWDMVWGHESKHWKHTLVAHMSILKKALGPRWNQRLVAHYGKGYLLNLRLPVSG